MIAPWMALAALLLGSGSGNRATAGLSSDTLLQVVLVGRHGVRTPTVEPDVLAAWAEQPWPQWKEALGELTARGGELATILGRYHRVSLAARGLFPATGCPVPGSVRVYADVVQRTVRTAEAFVDGFAPGCGVRIETAAPATQDPVFHPIQAGVCRIDPLEAQARILERVYGDLSGVVAGHREAVAPIQAALRCCAPDLCAGFGRPKTCSLPELPTALSSLADGKGIWMFGGLAVASDSAEIFLLEYADGMDAGAVGWGRVGWPEVREALELHDLAFDLLFRTPYLARRQGSSLLARVAGALTGRAFGGLPAPDLPVRDARLVAYVGHDTNISNLGGLLGATWAMPGYPVDETPPGGALVFERRRAADGRKRVFLSFVAQTPGQMRSAAPLTPAAPPIRTPVRIPGCSTEEDGFPCSVDDFARVVREALDADCVARP